jgi:hypothetical protein
LRLPAHAVDQFGGVASAPVLAAASRAGEPGSLADALALLSGRAGDPAAREEALAIAWAGAALIVCLRQVQPAPGTPGRGGTRTPA